MKKPLGKLTRVELREYWADEAREFTPWLAQEENLQLLGEAIGIDLELEDTEVPVGAFNADIVTKEVGTDDNVIIENQLERTNHDHLGKLITYASGLNARAVVWVCSQVTPEHRKALDWLNDITNEAVAFFGLEVELWQIGDSDPAPKFNLVCQPNEWAKVVTSRGTIRKLTETKLLQLEFWKGLVEFANAEGTFLSFRKPRPQHWYILAVGRSRFIISLTVHKRLSRIGCELYIHHKTHSKEAFALLAEEKDNIETALRAKLDWQELPLKNACRIAQFRSGDIDSRDSWPELFAWHKERAEGFHKVFSPLVKDLDLEDEELEEEQEDNEEE
ncbi:MAG: DUF4268 domain-containing protein [bacterium]|nr:DUF4268 domain-containing protein [bacterium]